MQLTTYVHFFLDDATSGVEKCYLLENFQTTLSYSSTDTFNIIQQLADLPWQC